MKFLHFFMTPENQEFRALATASGWNQAEIARRLELTPSAVSQFVRGDTKPSPQTIGYFKLILLNEMPEVLQPAGALRDAPMQPADANKIRRDLGAAIAALDTVRGQLEDIQLKFPPAPAPTPTDKAIKEAELSGVALIGAKAAVEALGLSPKVASTSGSSGAPQSRARRGKGGPQSPPAPVPAPRG